MSGAPRSERAWLYRSSHGRAHPGESARTWLGPRLPDACRGCAPAPQTWAPPRPRPVRPCPPPGPASGRARAAGAGPEAGAGRRGGGAGRGGGRSAPYRPGRLPPPLPGFRVTVPNATCPLRIKAPPASPPELGPMETPRAAASARRGEARGGAGVRAPGKGGRRGEGSGWDWPEGRDVGRVPSDLAGSREPLQLSPSWGSLGEGGQGPEGSRESAGLRAATASASPAPGGQPEFPGNFSCRWVAPETSPFPARESGRGPCAFRAWARSAARAEAMASAGKPPAPPPPSSALPTPVSIREPRPAAVGARRRPSRPRRTSGSPGLPWGWGRGRRWSQTA